MCLNWSSQPLVNKIIFPNFVPRTMIKSVGTEYAKLIAAPLAQALFLFFKYFFPFNLSNIQNQNTLQSLILKRCPDFIFYW